MLTWILCIVIAIVFLGVTLKYLFNQQKHRMGMAFIMLMCTGFFAYFPYYIAEYDFLNAVICDIVNLMQIVTLNSNSYETSQPDIANPVVFYAVIIIRGAVHLASPMVFAAATYTFITEKLENWNTNRVMTVSQAETIAHKAPQLLKKLGNSVYMGMHMDIVPFYEISEKTKDINNRCKDLDIKPKEDTFNKDDVIIKALPGILGNSSWQAETGGYVYKVVPETESNI